MQPCYCDPMHDTPFRLAADFQSNDVMYDLDLICLSPAVPRDAAVRFGPVQGHFPLNLKPDRQSGSPNSLNPELDLDEPVQMVQFRFRVI